MPPRAIKHRLTCPFELTSGSFLIGRIGNLVIPRNHLVNADIDLKHCSNTSDMSESASVPGSQIIETNQRVKAIGRFSQLMIRTVQTEG